MSQEVDGLSSIHGAQKMHVPHVRLFYHTMDGKETADPIQNYLGDGVGTGLVVGVAILTGQIDDELKLVGGLTLNER
jgi:hypothetical protein